MTDNDINASANQSGEGGGTVGTPYERREDTFNSYDSNPEQSRGRHNRGQRINRRNRGGRSSDNNSIDSTPGTTSTTVVTGFPGVPALLAPSEGGTKRKMDDVLEKMESIVISSWTYGADVASVLDTFEVPTLDEPAEPSPNCSKKESMRFDAQYRDFLEREAFLEENTKRLAHTVLQFCSPILKGKLQQFEGYSLAKTEGDAVWFLNKIRDVVYKVDHSKPKELSLDDALQAVIQYRQPRDMSVSDYVKRFVSHVKVLESIAGTYGITERVYDDLTKRAEEDTDSSLTLEEKLAKLKHGHRERTLAIAIIKRADDSRFRKLKEQLMTDFSLGVDKYPKTVDAAILALNSQNTTTRGHSFLQNRNQSESPVRAGSDGVTLRDDRVCFRCNHRGHIAPNCPDPPPNRDKGATKGDCAVSINSKIRIISSCFVNSPSFLHPSMFLLDSQSSVHLLNANCSLVRTVKSEDETLEMRSNGGISRTDLKTTIGCHNFWYDISSLANIFSLALILDKFPVTIHRGTQDLPHEMRVWYSETKYLPFSRTGHNLFIFDPRTGDNLNKLNSFLNTPFFNCDNYNYSFLQTEDSIKLKYNRRELQGADTAKELHELLWFQPQQKFQRIISKNCVRNVDVTVADIKRAEDIYGDGIVARGTTTRRAPEHVPDTLPVGIPKNIMDLCASNTLCQDFFFVNRIAIFAGYLRNIQHRWVDFPTSRKKEQIIRMSNRHRKYVESKGFRVTSIHADNEFECARDSMLPAELTTCAQGGHVPEVEHMVRRIKERTRTMTNNLPYICLPRCMTRAIVRGSVYFENAFPSTTGISDTLSPRNIVDQQPNLDRKKLLPFGSCVALATDEETTNTQRSRTIGAIVLDPKGYHGAYNFMSLRTGREVSGRVVRKIPINDRIIELVNNIGRQQKQPESVNGNLVFEWRPGYGIEEDDDNVLDDDYDQDDYNGDDELEIIPNPIDGFENIDYGLDREDENEAIDEADDASLISEQDAEINEILEEIVQVTDDSTVSDNEEQFEQPDENQGAQGMEEILVEDIGNENDDAVSTSSPEPEHREEERSRRRSHFTLDTTGGKGKRSKKMNPKYADYSFLNVQYREMDDTQRKHFVHAKYSFLQTKYVNMDKDTKDLFLHTAMHEFKATGNTTLVQRYATGFIFTQMSAKAGLKKHGKLAEQALMKEFMQLLDLDVFEPLRYDSITIQQRQDALRMVNLIKEKRDHTPEHPHLKGRSCANGSKQRPHFSREETHSPTVSLDSFMITLLVDALEGRDVAFADVPGAYLHAKMKDFVAMIITGEEVDILCKLKPEWSEFVVGEGKSRRMYVRLNKALYGCVQSALLWYELYAETLQGMGFQINPCDLCVANAVIKGRQCTICWYVDDNKISHVDPKVVDSIIAKIEAKFGKMTVTRNGQEDHNFLGIKVKMDKRLKIVEIDMKHYLLNALGLFLEDITKNAATPATSKLFDLREDSPLLNKERAENFHSVTALLLYVSQRCRLDIQTAVSFLTTRVSKPTEDDWSKLRRVLQYLRGTIDDKLILGGDSISHMRTWVDASYAVHQDRKSHTGGAISFGRGVVMSKSKKQKLNTKSSTEAEVVGVSDYMSEMIWARQFIECQGYDIEENVLYQDNESAIKIETNGKLSCGKQSKHIDIRYFFIKDRLSSEKIQVLHCPTYKMIADFFTKPLQGNLFRFLCNVIMGRNTIKELEERYVTSTQERVENSQK